MNVLVHRGVFIMSIHICRKLVHLINSSIIEFIIYVFDAKHVILKYK